MMLGSGGRSATGASLDDRLVEIVLREVLLEPLVHDLGRRTGSPSDVDVVVKNIWDQAGGSRAAPFDQCIFHFYINVSGLFNRIS